MSRNFSHSERIRVLLGCAAGEGNAAQAETWLVEAFAIARFALSGQERSGDQEGIVEIPSGIDLEKALELFRQQQLRLAIRIADANLALGKPGKARAVAETAFSAGAEAFRRDLEDHPGLLSYLVNGESDLASLVTSIFQRPSSPAWMLDDIECLNQPELECNLLLAIAAHRQPARSR